MIEKVDLRKETSFEKINDKLNEIINWINEYESDKWVIFKKYLDLGIKTMEKELEDD
jgi:hypothetical protein